MLMSFIAKQEAKKEMPENFKAQKSKSEYNNNNNLSRQSIKFFGIYASQMHKEADQIVARGITDTVPGQ